MAVNSFMQNAKCPIVLISTGKRLSGMFFTSQVTQTNSGSLVGIELTTFRNL